MCEREGEGRGEKGRERGREKEKERGEGKRKRGEGREIDGTFISIVLSPITIFCLLLSECFRHLGTKN